MLVRLRGYIVERRLDRALGIFEQVFGSRLVAAESRGKHRLKNTCAPCLFDFVQSLKQHFALVALGGGTRANILRSNADRGRLDAEL
ncbi:MAG: hypothetical protein WA651_09015 [Candidatus Sulfotelmatobacter sp.]